jgi:hypothetical protein
MGEKPADDFRHHGGEGNHETHQQQGFIVRAIVVVMAGAIVVGVIVVGAIVVRVGVIVFFGMRVFVRVFMSLAGLDAQGRVTDVVRAGRMIVRVRMGRGHGQL